MDEAAPHLLATTPPGQEHEIGALLAATTAAAEGWKVTHLGPNLPVEEIAAAALHSHARAIALSIVYPANDPRLRSDLRQLRDSARRYCSAGRRPGREGYSDVLDEIGALQVGDLPSLRLQLEKLRLAR